MQIRSARPADVPFIHDLVQRAYGVYVERISGRPTPMDDDYAEKVDRGLVFAADDGGVSGLIVLIQESDHLLIENVAVDPDRQGEGIGRALLAYAETSAQESGTPTVRLYTNAKMTENLALYSHLGYQEIDRRRENGFERAFLFKRLGDARPEAERVLRSAYRAFNARDVDAAVELMHPKVDWPNAWEGGRVIGRAAVRDYWNRQFAVVSSRVEPERFTEDSDGSITVDVHQVVHDVRTGEVVSDSHLRHRYRLEKGLVVRMDVVEPPDEQ